MPDGTVITKDNLDSWIRPQLPPQGKKNNTQDAAVLDWKIDATEPGQARLPERARGHDQLARLQERHPGTPIGRAQETCSSGNRPKLLFDPLNGRPAFPLLRTHVGVRPPFSGNGHTGAPWLGEQRRRDTRPTASTPPFDGRKDGLCPADAPDVRPFNLVGIETPIKNTESRPRRTPTARSSRSPTRRPASSTARSRSTR